MSARELEENELRSMAGRKPSAARMAYVTRSLSSKWEGTQSLAIKALGTWGDRESIDAIRVFLESAFDRKYGWAVRGVAIRTLVEIIGPEDGAWISQLFRSRLSILEQHELRPLVERLSSFPERRPD